MASGAIIKFDDGVGTFPTNCFPVRPLKNLGEEGSGAWLSAHRAEQRRRFKAVLIAKPRTYSEIHNERKKAGKGSIVPPVPLQSEIDEIGDEQILDGFFLMKHCCIEDPTELCSVNISGQNLTDVNFEDLHLFDSVAYVNAAENILPLECFDQFPIIRELELSLNGLRNCNIKMGSFPHLQTLDLSFNNLSETDLLSIGMLPKLKFLNISGNNFTKIPADIAQPFTNKGNHYLRYRNLEVLLLEDNRLSNISVFSALAGLSRLKHLDLSRNEFDCVPHLLAIEGRTLSSSFEPHQPSTRSSSKNGQRRSRKSSRASKCKTGSGKSSQQDAMLEVNTSRSDEQTHVQSPVHKDSVQNSSMNSNINANQEEEDMVQSVSAEGHLAVDHSDATHDTSEVPLGPITTEQSRDEPILETSEQQTADQETGFDHIHELNLAKLEEKVDAEIEKNSQEKNFQQFKPKEALMPPFPELQHLNLSHNKVEEEDKLLPLAAWPCLAELVIHSNPLTITRSGEPPLLSRFLQDRLGISIIRKKETGPKKPQIKIAQLPERKVKHGVPNMPKHDINELLHALETGIQQQAITAPLSADEKPEVAIQGGKEESTILYTASPTTSPKVSPRPLPPIRTVTVEDLGAEADDEDDDVPFTVEYKQAPEQTRQDVEEEGAFFMTQINTENTDCKDLGSEQAINKQDHYPEIRRDKPTDTEIPDNFKGYEILLQNEELDAFDDEELPNPNDVGSNVRSLNYILRHPLVFNKRRQTSFTNGVVHFPQRPLGLQRKSGTSRSTHKKPETRGEKVDKVLTNLHKRQTVVEEDLSKVLNTNTMRKEFGGARALLSDIQKRYNMVRTSSMKQARNLQEIRQELLNDADKLAKS